MNKPNDLIVYNIARIYVLLDQFFERAYQAFGLNPAKFNLLMVIKHKGKEQGLAQAQLGSQLFVSAANITKLIDALQSQGLVTRETSLGDRRVKLIKITEKGSKLLDDVWVKHTEAVNSLLLGFSQEEKIQFNEFLERFKKEREITTSKV